jgi:hypothetical protein
VFALGRTSLRHVEVVARLLNGEAARPGAVGGCGGELAGKADSYTAAELYEWGTALVELLDQDARNGSAGRRTVEPQSRAV